MKFRGAVGNQRGAILTDAAGGDGGVAVQQTLQCLALLAPGDDPKHAARTIKNGVRQRQAAASLIEAGWSNVSRLNIENSISGYQRCRMAIGAQAQVDKVQHGRGAGNLFECYSVGLRRRFQIVLLYRHGINLMGTERFAELREVSIWSSFGRHAFIDLDDEYIRPGQFVSRKLAEH